MKATKRSSAFMLMLAIVALLFGGCAGMEVGLKDGPIMDNGKQLDLTVRPDESLGVRVTPALKAGEVTVFELPITDSQIGGEMYPGRIMFPGIVVNAAKEEFFAQSILVEMYPDTGQFMSFVIVDSKMLDMKGAKFLPLSSHTDYFWDQVGNPIAFDRKKFHEDKSYRDELVLEQGVDVESRKLITGFDKIVKAWNMYSTTGGYDMYSPLGEEDIKRIAKINPGYTPIEKLVLRNRTVISINPIEMLAKASITVFEAVNGKNQGWDYTSEIPSRPQMAMIVEFLGSFRMELIKNLNNEIAKLKAR